MNESEKLITLLDRGDFLMGIRIDDIIHVKINHGGIVNRHMQDRLIQTLVELKNGDERKLPAVVELGDFISVMGDQQLHELSEFSELLRCIVIVVDNAGHRMLAKFYEAQYQPLDDFLIKSNFQEAIVCINQLMQLKP